MSDGGIFKNSKKKTRRTTSAIWSIFADLNSPYLLNFPIKVHYRYKLNIDGGKDVLTCFLTWNYFESYDAEFNNC